MNEHANDQDAAEIVTAPSEESAIDRLVRAGILRAPIRTLDDEFWSLSGPEDPHGETRAYLIAERREGR